MCGQLVGQVVVVAGAAGQGVHARQDYGDVVLLEKIEHHPGVAGAYYGYFLHAHALGKAYTLR